MNDKNGNQAESRREPSSRDLDGILRRCRIRLSPQQIRQLWIYHQLLREHNTRLNLTRIHSFAAMAVKLYADSILPGTLMTIPSPLLDLGTGAGMPGIPLKIAFPKLEILLAEGRGKRVEFLEEAVEKLKLSGVQVIGHGINARFQQPVQAVITRAVGSMVETMERVRGCLAEGGLLIFMKGPRCHEEILHARRTMPGEYALHKDLHYRLGDTEHRRRLVVFTRTGVPPWTERARAMKRHAVRVIESDHNEVFKNLRRTLTPKGIKRLKEALVAGSKQVREVIKDFPDAVTGWISCGDSDAPPPDAPAHMVWYQLERSLFRELDLFGTKHPMLLIRAAPLEPWDVQKGLPNGCSVLVPFQDPENVGAVIRSAVAFGADRIILLEESANPYHPKALRASGGAVLRGNLMRGPSIQDLPRDMPILALSARGEDIGSFRFPETFGLLPGLEGPGLPAQWKGDALSIPICEEVESLNAAAATAIVLYVWSCRTRGQGLSHR
ncbi:MAG: 16S rRNA (guanine(527)-N(7))-methyltransferase RsmG [Deltaproteobacteria bacterium]|nr:16S rRNA (guanine(527)-N(7))-methyltransferase RsmG [Deltaproteobacteria bacterium]